MKTGHGTRLTRTEFESVDVTRPILAVHRLGDAGAPLISLNGCVDVHLPNGDIIALERRGGQHVMRVQRALVWKVVEQLASPHGPRHVRVIPKTQSWTQWTKREIHL